MAHTAHLTHRLSSHPLAPRAAAAAEPVAPAPNAHDMLQLEADAASDSHLSIDWDTLPILHRDF